jgi:hypothetical protein
MLIIFGYGLLKKLINMRKRYFTLCDEDDPDYE